MTTAILDHLWQSTAVALLAATLTLLLRHNSAASRYWLWFVASLKFLVPFSLLTAIGERLLLPAPPSIVVPATLVVAQQMAEPFSSPAPVVALHDGGIDWIPIVALIWAAGAVLVMLVWWGRWRQIAAALRQASPLDLPGPLQVLASPVSLEPGLIGIWRPVLLLPSGIAERLTAGEMESITAHELSHLRRHDNATGIMHMLVQALFWFHPAVWWIGSRLVEERERACDEAVLDAGHDPQTYAEAILKVCKFYLHSPLACAAGVSGPDLRRRVETIMAPRRVLDLAPAKVLVLVVAAVCVVAAPVMAGYVGRSLMSLEMLPSETEVSRNLALQGRPRTAVPFDPRKFDAYVGHYHAHAMFTISREGERFFTQLTLGVNQTRMTPKLRIEVFPESETKFFARDVPAQYSFVTDASGRVTEMIYHQSGLERRFRRIDQGAARQIEAAVLERIRRNQPSPGTKEALERYIVGLQTGRPNYGELARGIGVRVRWTLPVVQPRVNKFGALESLTFTGVGPDGMDVYRAKFANRELEWWIAPLVDGRVTWSGYGN